ncbi:uncharacterized protein TNCV_3914711 [Trichonephila clavipes]|nr:uncharacterized protein TNCV_3914711 [Trichonephila clavipes]
MTHFNETLRVCEGQRYEVTIPWLAGHLALCDKYDLAESKLRNITKRLIRENNFEDYHAVFQQWELEGIIESVPNYQCTELTHYFPHRPVFKPSSITTKVRSVFDASFKQPGYASLNECLSVGPSLIHQILPLLLRLSSGNIGEDAKLDKLKIYRHGRVVFGISSSPFLLNATVKYHLGQDKFQTEALQNTMDKFKEGFYVDNLVTSVNDIKELGQQDYNLHIFTDASSHGYAFCAFLRFEDQEEMKVSMVLAKARIAPVKRPTIPRLELLGAVMGARISLTILESLHVPLKTYF